MKTFIFPARHVVVTVAICCFVLAVVPSYAQSIDGKKERGQNQQASNDEKSSEESTLIADDEFKMVDYPIAIVPFQSRGKEVEGMGANVSDLMFAKLAVDPSLLLVDREYLDTTLGEAELNLSALVKPAEAIQVGQLTGARLLVTGSVFQIDESIYTVAKVIGTETSRVVGASAKGAKGESLDDIVKRLGDEVLAAIKKNSDSLVAKPVSKKSQIEKIKTKLKGRKLPKVMISIKEQHVGSNTIDPAAETELTIYLQKCGFEVIDAKQGSEKQADMIIKGEGMSEFATRTKNLVSVRARLEVKVVDRVSGKVVVADRQTCMAVGLAEQIAAKHALEKCANKIAEHVLPKMAKKRK